MSRPTKFTPETQKRIIDALKQGMTYALAATHGGITYQTFNEWMRRGAKAKTGAFRQFYEDVTSASVEALMKWLEKIERASDTDWRAAAWKIERRFPRIYGRTVTEHAFGDDIIEQGIGLIEDIKQMSDTQLEAMLAKFAADLDGDLDGMMDLLTGSDDTE